MQLIYKDAFKEELGKVVYMPHYRFKDPEFDYKTCLSDLKDPEDRAIIKEMAIEARIQYLKRPR